MLTPGGSARSHAPETRAPPRKQPSIHAAMWGQPPPPPPSADLPFTALVTAAILLLCAGGCLWITMRSCGTLENYWLNYWPSYHSSPSNAGGWRRPYALALAINVLAVSIDGRFDAEDLLDSEGHMTKLPWPTLFSPAGFAFAIWGLIYVGELVGLAVVLSAGGADAIGGAAVERAVRASNTPWLAANCAQALWCVAFRPWALELLWLPTLLLGTSALCLLYAQRRLLTAAAEAPVPPAALAALAWPRSLHLGWLLAAALVNLNAWVGKLAVGPAAALAVAIITLVGAALAGATLLRARLPVATLALSWALFAASKGTPVGADAAALGAPTLAGLAHAEAATAAALAAAAVAWAVLPSYLRPG